MGTAVHVPVTAVIVLPRPHEEVSEIVRNCPKLSGIVRTHCLAPRPLERPPADHSGHYVVRSPTTISLEDALEMRANEVWVKGRVDVEMRERIGH